MWPVIRPALVLLGSDPVIAVVNGKGSEQALVDALMLHFAHPRSQSDPSLLLLILPWTDRLKAHPSFAGALAAAGGEVARLAGELRSSGAGAAQAALLHAARLVGPDLIRTALEALVATLDAANQRTTPPFAFSGSTGALLALCRNHGEVRQVARAEDLEAARSGLDRALRELWRRVAQNPLILAGFSIPERTTAHPTIVHNMALATCAVEDVLELPGLTDVLRAAANEQQQLSVPIQRATTGYAAFKLTGAPSVPLPAGDNAEAFYAALPFELSLVAKLPRESSASVVERAMTGAMRHGPRMEDGGVWLAAALFDLSPDAELLGDYAARIESLDDDDATLSLLRPLVARLRPT